MGLNMSNGRVTVMVDGGLVTVERWMVGGSGMVEWGRVTSGEVG